jgi:hypothetical protein
MFWQRRVRWRARRRRARRRAPGGGSGHGEFPPRVRSAHSAVQSAATLQCMGGPATHYDLPTCRARSSASRSLAALNIKLTTEPSSATPFLLSFGAARHYYAALQHNGGHISSLKE